LLLAQLGAREKAKQQRVAIITADAVDAQRLQDEMAFFAPDLRCVLFPDWETLPYDSFSPHQDLISERLATLWRISQGDADVVFVHDQAAEEKFVAEGFGLKRWPVMYNDFVLVGPKTDPAASKGKDIVAALTKLAAANAAFVSRGDKSGTHAAELRYWKIARLEAAKGSGYRECGCGMGPALNMAASLGAYVLADRGTWLNFKNRADLVVLVEGDQRLFNQYGVMVVNPAKHTHIKQAEAQKFVDWVTSAAGQASIAEYKIGGEPLFFPNAHP